MDETEYDSLLSQTNYIMFLSFILTQVMVEDVNDNSPAFSSPTYLKVHKKSFGTLIKKFSLNDPDDWSLGHGPPFGAKLDPRAPRAIADAIRISYSSGK